MATVSAGAVSTYDQRQSVDSQASLPTAAKLASPCTKVSQSVY